MYDLLDKKSAIAEIQKYLYTLSAFSEYKNLRVSVDGIYGEETRKAVMEFQNSMGLSTTGLVDMETYNALYSEYKKSKNKTNTPDKAQAPFAFPMKQGAFGHSVDILTFYVNELAREYTKIPTLRPSQYFSEETKDAIIEIQDIFKIEKNGIVDYTLYQRIQREIEAIGMRKIKYE